MELLFLKFSTFFKNFKKYRKIGESEAIQNMTFYEFFMKLLRVAY